jgi:hypothetical protein
MNAKKYVEAIVVKGVSLDCNDTSDHTIFTCPYAPDGSAYKFIPTMMVLRDFSATPTSHTFSAGRSDAKTDFCGTITSSGAGTTKDIVIRPNVSAAGTAQTPAAGNGLMTQISSGQTFVIDNIAAAGGACTCYVDLFGYYR